MRRGALFAPLQPPIVRLRCGAGVSSQKFRRPACSPLEDTGPTPVDYTGLPCGARFFMSGLHAMKIRAAKPRFQPIDATRASADRLRYYMRVRPIPARRQSGTMNWEAV